MTGVTAAANGAMPGSLAGNGSAAVMGEVLAALASWYARWDAGESVAEAYRARCDTLGRRVRVLVPGGQVEGRASGVDADGALIVETSTGPRTFGAGDVVHLRPGDSTGALSWDAARRGSPTAAG